MTRMRRNDRLSANLEGPSPSVRREDGIRDARLGRPRISSDRDYGIGYDLGIRFGRDGITSSSPERSDGQS